MGVLHLGGGPEELRRGHESSARSWLAGRLPPVPRAGVDLRAAPRDGDPAQTMVFVDVDDEELKAAAGSSLVDRQPVVADVLLGHPARSSPCSGRR
eukprot:5686047-Alexandrium_andersonii.AAC.1